MNFLVLIRTTTLIILLLTCGLSRPITDIRIRRLIRQIFYIPPSGEPYFNVSVLQTTRQAPDNICSSGVCVPFHLCVNGNVVTTGANLFSPRIGLEDDSEEPQYCSESEKCCKLSYDDDNDDNNSDEETNYKSEEITNTSFDSSEDIDDDYVDTDIDYSDNWQPKCGVRNFNMLQPRISGEEKAGSAEFPWMVMVLKKMSSSEFYDYQCGGSLIHPSAVLTAAHCVLNIKPKFLYIRAGEWDMANTNEILPHQDRDIQSVVIHREFYKPTLLNDIAVLILKTPVDLAENVNTVCLPPPNYSFDKERCLVSGWGKDSLSRESRFQTVLKKLELPIIPIKLCQMMFRNTILGKYFRLHKSFICAGAEIGRDTCKGDGGSPLVCKISGTSNSYYQAGIVSWGIGCKESNIPGAYVNVARFRDWIDKVMQRMKLESNSYIHE